MISPNASNWVDRGQAPEPELTRVLAFYLGKDPAVHGVHLRGHVTAIRGMVEASASEFDLMGYLRSIEEQEGLDPGPVPPRRSIAVALWHIAKCAEVRDRAQRLLDTTRVR
jgi:hypothetical protein